MFRRFSNLKKLIILGLSALILFAFASCNKADITDYKSAQKDELQTYANTKIEDCYSPEQWGVLCNHVEDGKKAIDEATKKSDVDAVVTRTIKSIDGVEPIGLYSLEFAYKHGFINTSNIKDIGFYHNGGKEWVECKCDKNHTKEDTETKCLAGFVKTDFVPTAKTPETLDEATLLKIKQRWIDYIEYHMTGMDEYTPDVLASIKEALLREDFSNHTYYGTYNGYSAIMLEVGMSLQVIGTETVADTVFYYNNSNRILIWDNNT